MPTTANFVGKIFEVLGVGQMREANTYRGARRNAVRRDAEFGQYAMHKMERFDTFKTKSKRQRLFEKLGEDVHKWFQVARTALMTSPRATPPTFRAIIKTCKELAQSPTLPPHGFPVYIATPRHMRGSWRSK